MGYSDQIPPNGWLIIDKAEGVTSTRVGAQLKRLLKTKKIGHVGTLDPFATGVLPIAIGEATKTIPYVDTDVKEYVFELAFGEERDTGDLTGKVTATSGVRPSLGQIQTVLPSFVGEITQVPPIYSALRINGVRAYELARQGLVPEMKARQVKIFELELLSHNLPYSACFRVLCSTGTYVRTLGADLAGKLGAYGHLKSLRRSKVGKFLLKDAFLLENLKENGHITEVTSRILPIRTVLDDIPAVTVSEVEEQKIRQGQAILDSFSFPEKTIVLLLCRGLELGLAEKKQEQLFPIRVFNFSK